MHKGAILLFLLALATGSAAFWTGDKAFFSGDETPAGSHSTVSETSATSEKPIREVAIRHILIMAEDDNPQSVERSDQLSQKILAGIAGPLLGSGHRVYDETAITDENYVQGRTKRNREELIDIARHVDSSTTVDTVIFVVVERDLYPGPNYDRIGVRLHGQVINTNDSRYVGIANDNFHLLREKGCIADSDLSCVESALNENPQDWGREFGDQINGELKLP